MRRQKNKLVKYCRGCGVRLTDDNWFPSSKATGQYICKKCEKKRQEKYYSKDYHRNWYHKHREDILRRRRERNRLNREKRREERRSKREELLNKLGKQCYFSDMHCTKTILFHNKSGEDHDRSFCYIENHLEEFVLLCAHRLFTISWNFWAWIGKKLSKRGKSCGVLNVKFRTSNIEVEVKYKKAGNELLVPKPPIRLRTFDNKLVENVRVVADKRYLWHGKNLATEIKLVDPETQKEVPTSEALEILEHYKYKLIDVEGNEVDKEDIQHFAVEKDGKETPVSPFSRTSVIDIPDENWVPSPSIEGFLITSVYEIFAGEKEKAVARALFEEAEKRLKADQIGITNFSWGRGFIQYYAFLCPFFKDGKYVWLMKLSDTKLAYNHLQDPPIALKSPIREAPTLKTLPPVKALVVASKKK